ADSMIFFLPVVSPRTTHQAKKIVRVGGFTKLADKPELKAVVSDYMTLLRPYAPAKPIEGAIRIHLEFTFPWRKSEQKKNRAKGAIPMTSKPDWDNMAKTIVDVMVKLGALHRALDLIVCFKKFYEEEEPRKNNTEDDERGEFYE
ncbi:MAG: RusA family crossover junction endodeoxyribonuclease, partial [Akkermansia sp.]